MSREWWCQVGVDVGRSAAPADVVLAVALVWWASWSLWSLRLAVGAGDVGRLRLLVGAGALFQIGHFGEHLQQVAVVARDATTIPHSAVALRLVAGLGWLVGGDNAGQEALHFFGDLIYTAGIVAGFALLRASGARSRLAAGGAVFQVAHQIEHVALFVSTVTVGRPLGLTTIGGLVWARVVVHFALNLGGSVLWLASLPRTRRAFSVSRTEWWAAT